jgi:hypothetical protein
VGQSGTLVPFSKITEASIFNDEQFWGRAARASGDSQESGRPLIFGASSELRWVVVSRKLVFRETITESRL